MSMSRYRLTEEVAKDIRNNVKERLIFGQKVKLPAPQTAGTFFQQEAYSIDAATKLINSLL